MPEQTSALPAFRDLALGLAVCGLLLGATAAGAAEQPRTIVGLWSAPGSGSCRMADGATRIASRSLVNDDVECRFRSVERRGRTVIFRGVCDDAEGSSEQTVTARERDGRLSIAFSPGGNTFGDLRRCGG